MGRRATKATKAEIGASMASVRYRHCACCSTHSFPSLLQNRINWSFHSCLSVSLHCCFVSHAAYLVWPFSSLQASLVYLTFLVKMSFVDRKAVVAVICLLLPISPGPKCQSLIQTLFGYWVDTDHRLWALISWHFVTFLSDAHVFRPACPHFVIWRVAVTWKAKSSIDSGGQSTQPQYLSQSKDTPGQIWLGYKWKLLSHNFTWVKVLEYLLLKILKYSKVQIASTSKFSNINTCCIVFTVDLQ